jgi:predicted nuclease with TOPRIM domain
MEGVLVITFLFGGGTLFLLAISPVGRALAERIRRQGGAVPPEDVRAQLEEFRSELLGEVQQLRTELSELGERMDFAERLLAKQREAERLGPPR